MVDFKALYVPSVQPLDLPRCEAHRQTTYANDHLSSDRQCKWSARYNINGRFLCKKHAGPEALKILSEMSK